MNNFNFFLKKSGKKFGGFRKKRYLCNRKQIKLKTMMIFNNKKEIQEVIKKQITSNDIQSIKAMMRIYEYQTFDEQERGSVDHNNGVGFAGTDAGILTSFCHQYEKKGYLSAKQIEIIKKKMGKYAGQLTNQAIQKGIYVKNEGKWYIANQISK